MPTDSPSRFESSVETRGLDDREFGVRALWVYASLAVTLGIYHLLEINVSDWLERRAPFHEGIVSGEWKSPYQYRVLVPFAAELASRVLEFVGAPAQYAREAGYIAIRVASNLALFVLFDRLCRRWLTREIAVAATLLLGALCLYTMRAYYFQPSSSVNIALLAGACVLSLEGRLRSLYALMFVAALNRETSGLIVAFFLAAQFGKPRWAGHTVGLVAVWAGVQLGLRAVFGLAESFEGPSWVENFDTAPLLWVVGLFGVLWWLPIRRHAQLPTFLQRALLLTLPVLVAVNFAFGKVEETRLFLDLALVLVPASFILLFGRRPDAPD